MHNKVAIITDMHFGAGGRNMEKVEVYTNFFRKFYEGTFLPEIHKRDIHMILMLGDTFDRRQDINFNALDQAKKMFFDKLWRYHCYILIGNHDTYFTNTNRLNSPNHLLASYDNFELISVPETIEVLGTDILFLPWICQDNKERSFELIESTKAKICVGHLEIEGFAKYRTDEARAGLSMQLLSKFDLVLSGHYHHKNSKGNVHYVGNPYEMTRNDIGDPRGFHILDLDTNHMEFIPNPNKLFHVIKYTDDIKLTGNEDFEGSYVDVIIDDFYDAAKKEKFIEQLNKMNCADVKVVDKTLFNIDNNLELESAGELKTRSAFEVAENYIKENVPKEQQESIKKYIKKIHDEAAAEHQE